MNISATLRRAGTLFVFAKDHTRINSSLLKQFMRISFVVAVIFLITMQVLFAMAGKAQSIRETTVTFELKDENLETAIYRIEAQSPFRFYYRRSEIKNLAHFHLPLAKRTIDGVLQELLKNTFISFKQINNNILLEQKEQAGYEVKGKVINSSHQPVGLATVNLKQMSSNKIIQSRLTDTGGYFKLTIKDKGDYQLLISAEGMDSLSVGLTLADQVLVQVPDLLLNAASNRLKEVSIVGKKPFIEQKIDRTLVNVGGLISNEGSNALEILGRSPGVTVDGNGNISFKGKSGVMVLIDDRATYLSPGQLAAYLKSMPSSLLDQIELMDNPPAKYDAAGGAGLINIKTKKYKMDGFNGSLSASYGMAHYGQTSESLNLNYRTHKVNLFANAAYSLNQVYRTTELGRMLFDAGGNLSSSFKQLLYIKPKTNNTSLKLGMDYEQSPKTTWGIVLTGNLSPGKLEVPSTNYVYNSNGVLDSTVLANNRGKNQFNNGAVNLNYTHKFDAANGTLTFDLNYLKYSAADNESFLNQILYADGTPDTYEEMNSSLPAEINIYVAKTDYSQSIKGNGKVEMGLKSSYVNTNNEAMYFNRIDGSDLLNYNFSNQFLYKENINAAYLNFNRSFKRFELQAGLRIENTNASGHQIGNVLHPDSSFVKHYTNLFPTAYLSYKLDTGGNHKLVGSYGRRIGRPYYKDLNPFVFPSDKFTYTAGNPFLRPQFSDNYKLAYYYKSIFSAAIFYSHVTDFQSEVVKQEGNVFIDGTGNIGNSSFIGLSANATVEPTDWLTFNSYAQVVRNQYKGQLVSGYLDQSSTYFETNITGQFNLSEGWTAELSGFYVGRIAKAQAIVDPIWQINTGIQKKVMQNRASVKLNIRDIFDSYRSNGVTNFIPNVSSYFNNRFNTQTFTLGFTYNFGKSVNNNIKRRNGGAETEQGRVKN